MKRFVRAGAQGLPSPSALGDASVSLSGESSRARAAASVPYCLLEVKHQQVLRGHSQGNIKSISWNCSAAQVEVGLLWRNGIQFVIKNMNRSLFKSERLLQVFHRAWSGD